MRRLASPFRPISLALGATTVTLAAALAVLGPVPEIAAVLVLGGLYALAENRDVVLPNGSSVSAGFMLAMASVVVFRDSSPLLGPLSVGAFGCLFLPHIRGRQWAKIATNASIFSLSSTAAACVFLLVPEQATSAVIGQLFAALPIGLTFSLVNFALLVPVVAAVNKAKPGDVAKELWLGDLQIYPFALLGVVLGRLYLDVGIWVVPLFVAPIFIARQAFASYMDLRAAQEATLSTLIRALEAKDKYTAGHVERVARFAQYMGQELGFRPSRLERLRYAALMHDIGKLIVPNHILNKPGKLTAAEYQRMRHHDFVSVELLRRIDFLAPVVPSIEGDHMTSGSNGHAPLEARIVMVADAFDAMTSTRAYRRALTQEVAFSELRDKAGVQFDAACVEALIRAIEARGDRYGSGYEEAVAEFKAPPPIAGTGSAGLGDLAGDPERVP
jgi:putative nucleotidyltransferase with HDIG domain